MCLLARSWTRTWRKGGEGEGGVRQAGCSVDVGLFPSTTISNDYDKVLGVAGSGSSRQ